MTAQAQSPRMLPRCLRLMVRLQVIHHHQPPNRPTRGDELALRRPTIWVTMTDRPSPLTPNTMGKTLLTPFPPIELHRYTPLLRHHSAPKEVRVPATGLSTKIPRLGRSGNELLESRLATSRSAASRRLQLTLSRATFRHRTLSSRPRMSQYLSSEM